MKLKFIICMLHNGQIIQLHVSHFGSLWTCFKCVLMVLLMFNKDRRLLEGLIFWCSFSVFEQWDKLQQNIKQWWRNRPESWYCGDILCWIPKNGWTQLVSTSKDTYDNQSSYITETWRIDVMSTSDRTVGVWNGYQSKFE